MPSPRRRGRFWLGLWVGVAVGIIVGSAGGVFASNISLGSNAIEFGQGSVSVAACDNSITVTPQSSYIADGIHPQRWVMTGLELSNIDVAKCAGKLFTVDFSAGIPEFDAGGLGFDPTLRPYKYSFTVDWRDGNFVAGPAGCGAGHSASGYEILSIDGVQADPGNHYFSSCSQQAVAADSQSGRVTLITRVLAQDVAGIQLETSEQ